MFQFNYRTPYPYTSPRVKNEMPMESRNPELLVDQMGEPILNPRDSDSTTSSEGEHESDSGEHSESESEEHSEEESEDEYGIL